MREAHATAEQSRAVGSEQKNFAATIEALREVRAESNSICSLCAAECFRVSFHGRVALAPQTFSSQPPTHEPTVITQPTQSSTRTIEDASQASWYPRCHSYVFLPCDCDRSLVWMLRASFCDKPCSTLAARAVEPQSSWRTSLWDQVAEQASRGWLGARDGS